MLLHTVAQSQGQPCKVGPALVAQSQACPPPPPHPVTAGCGSAANKSRVTCINRIAACLTRSAPQRNRHAARRSCSRSACHVRQVLFGESATHRQATIGSAPNLHAHTIYQSCSTALRCLSHIDSSLQLLAPVRIEVHVLQSRSSYLVSLLEGCARQEGQEVRNVVGS